jgi:hypothetical protein
MKRFSIAIVAAIVFAVAGVTLASADSGSSHKGSGHRIEVFSKTVQFAAIDLGTQGPSLGDEFVFSDDLLTHKGGDKVGIDGGVCTIVRQDAATKTATLQCAVTLSLQKGQIATQALLSMTNGQFTARRWARSPAAAAGTGGPAARPPSSS